MNRITVVITCVVVALAACGAPKRAVKTEQELLARRAQTQMFAGAMKAGVMEALCRHAHKEREADPNFSLDILVLSGGGDFGAYGTGLLRGWSEDANPPMKLPKWDIVTGVSTGALIAPFAYLGSKDDLVKVDEFYRNPKPDWVKTRGLLFFLPENASFLEVPGLERELDKIVTPTFLERIAAEAGQHVQQVMRVAHPVVVPFHLVVELLALGGEFGELVNQGCSRGAWLPDGSRHGSVAYFEVTDRPAPEAAT